MSTNSLDLNVFLFLFICRGVGPGCNTREIADKLIDLKLELEDLDRRERELDQQRVWVQQSIKNVTDDSLNSPYPSSYIFRIHLLSVLTAVHYVYKTFMSFFLQSQRNEVFWGKHSRIFIHIVDFNGSQWLESPKCSFNAKAYKY